MIQSPASPVGRVVFDLQPVRPTCSVCGYDVRATVTLSGTRCTECGARLPFDRLRVPVHASVRATLRRAAPLLRPLCVVMLVAAVIAAIIAGSPWRHIATASASTIAAVTVLRVASPGLPASRRWCLAALIAAVLQLGTWPEIILIAVVVLALATVVAAAECGGRGVRRLYAAILRPGVATIAALRSIALTRGRGVYMHPIFMSTRAHSRWPRQ